MHKSGIFGILEYSEPFHNCVRAHSQNPVIFTKVAKQCVTVEIQNPDIFKTRNICRPVSKIEKKECFAKIVKSYIYFSKPLYLRPLARFSITPSRNKYTLTCRVTRHNVLYETYSEYLFKANQSVYIA